jgi:hypothetical protein
MSTTVVIPDFTYTAHFYPEFLEDLTRFMRIECPELTDEDPTEPHMQLLRSFALSSHLNATLIDVVANEMFLPTAKLRTSHVALLALIDVHLRQASPASTTIVSQLSKLFTAAQTVIPAGSLFATLESRAAQAVEFEALDTVEITLRTDEVGQVYGYAFGAPGSYTDHTVEARSVGGNFSPAWAGASAGDALYIGHPDVQFNQLNFNIATGAVQLPGVWEYFDGDFDQGQPSSVVNNGSTLTFNINSILGSADRTGTVVRVRSAITGAFQDIASTFSAGNNLVTTGGADPFLGQSSPSTTSTDYIVGSEWRELSGVIDGTNGLQTTGANTVTFTLPQSLTQAWTRFTVGEGLLAVDGFWVRFRVVSVGGGPVIPSITQIRIDQGQQFLAFPVTQGHTRSDNPLGSSDGTDSQSFILSQLPVIDDDNIVVTVNESSVDQVYARVDNFLNSLPTDRHFKLLFDDDGAAVITFGDGTNGKIPTAGVNNIKVAYRTMDDIDGNVGSNTVTVNRSGIAYLSTISNPRAASGYAIREGSTEEDLARLKVAGPASLRTRRRAVTPEDAEVMATQFKAADGSSPVARALAIEEAFGPKTVELVVVGPGGTPVDASKLSEIADFFNGTDDEEGVLVLNHQLTPSNFTMRSINVTMTLEGGNPTSVVTALTVLLNPLAKKTDGTYIWAFGGKVALAQLIHAIMDTTPPPTNCALTVPAVDVALGTRELPVKGTITINGVVY